MSDEIETLKSKLNEIVTRLEDVEESLKRLNELVKSTQTVKPLKSYKVGQFVSILVPGEPDPENGRIVEFSAGKSAVFVATAKGEFTVGDPNRIRPQGDSW